MYLGVSAARTALHLMRCHPLHCSRACSSARKEAFIVYIAEFSANLQRMRRSAEDEDISMIMYAGAIAILRIAPYSREERDLALCRMESLPGMHARRCISVQAE